MIAAVRTPVRWALLLLLIAFLSVFFVGPMLQMLVYSFYKYSAIKLMVPEWTVSNYVVIVRDSYVLNVFLRTLRLAALATVVSAVLGYVIAFRMRQASGWEQMFLALVVLSPLMMSPIVLAYAWMVILAPHTGLLNSAFTALHMPAPRIMYTETGILVGLVYEYLVFMVLSLHAALENVDPSVIRAAQVLGANPRRVLVRVLLPLTMPGLVSGSLLVFAISSSSFLMPLILGGRQTPVVATYAYDLASFQINWPGASAVAMTLATVTLAAVGLYVPGMRLLERRLGA